MNGFFFRTKADQTSRNSTGNIASNPSMCVCKPFDPNVFTEYMKIFQYMRYTIYTYVRFGDFSIQDVSGCDLAVHWFFGSYTFFDFEMLLIVFELCS